MASTLFTLLDDIATLLDDVAVMTKVAAKKTAGVLGDDLALNANQVAGVRADRELPVVWAVAKGSMINKAILVPVALLIAAFLPVLITPLLMLGGAYLCFEGAEKVLHKVLLNQKDVESHHQEIVAANTNPQLDLVQFEREKIKGAIRTDFILSAEIIVITLGTVTAASLQTKIGVLVGISMLMTVGVYGLVAGIVKLDDLGLHLQAKGGAAASFGRALLAFAPWLMKALSFFGTLAMFLVGGGILTHGIPVLYTWLQNLAAEGGAIGVLGSVVVDGLFGFVCGALIVGAVKLSVRIRQ